MNIRFTVYFILLFPAFFVETAIGDATKDIAFNVGWDKFQPSAINFRDLTHDAPAGKHGHVVARGDELYFTDGKRARFWGVGLTFSNDGSFPPDKDTADVLARRIASLGFNHVRLVGMDDSGRKPLMSWLQTGHLAHNDLDRLGYFIARLKLEGIYYSFSINNNAIALLDDILGRAGNTAARTKLWRYKNIRLYNVKAIDQIVRWYEKVYSWTNPYTELSFAQDPANIYLAAVNEDSVFSAYFSGFELLDDKSRALLESEFEERIVKNYGSWALVESAWNEESQSKQCLNFQQNKGELLLRSLGRKQCHRQQKDIIDFLIETDRRFYVRVRDALRSIGYKGLFTGTNNWYGYGNLYANSVAGDYIESHGYFDHPKRSIAPVLGEGIIGHSYVSRDGKKNEAIEKEHSYPLSKTFRSALVGRPLVISEWGHSGWGQFSYEGLALLASYASFQGYPAMSAHTFFNHPNPNPRDIVTRKAMAISGNPVLLSLMPSFALAFLRGDITSPETSHVTSCAKTYDSFLAVAGENGLRREDSICDVYDWLGYTRKIRTQLVSDISGKMLSVAEPRAVYQSETGEIIWGGINDDNDYFAVSSPRFKLATTPHTARVTFRDSYNIDFESHGIVTMISLDEKPVSELHRVLITVAQSFRNTRMETLNLGGRLWILDVGKSPAILTIPIVSISMRMNHLPTESVAICGLSPDGSINDLGDAELMVENDGTFIATFKLGNKSGPWYVLSPRSPNSCTGDFS